MGEQVGGDSIESSLISPEVCGCPSELYAWFGGPYFQSHPIHNTTYIDI